MQYVGKSFCGGTRNDRDDFCHYYAMFVKGT